ncbi:MAG: sensor histidine kinase [Candidatus Onthomonas sp.]
MKGWSIKLRVTLWFTLFMTLPVALALSLLFVMGRSMVFQTLQEDLIRAVTDAAGELDSRDGLLDVGRLDTFSEGVYLTVYDAEGHPLYGKMPYGYADRLAFQHQGFQISEQWYLYDLSLTVEGYGPVWIRGVVSWSGLACTFSSLYRLALIVLPLLVLLAALGGYLLVRAAFRPVRQITATAERISSGSDLTQRIHLGPGRDELHRLAAVFDHMLDRLQAAFQREQQFTSDVSHKLRAPVSVILSQCEYALEQEQTPEEYQEALSAVYGQARGMSSLISQLFTLARADQGRAKLQLEQLDFSALAQSVAEQMEEQAEATSITLETDIQPGIALQGDETLLMRMPINLLDNGIRYGRPGGQLRLTLASDEAQVTGTVADDGIGITAQQLPHIWERFYQADPARGASGAGLGLSMVRYIVQAHRGSISVRSTPGVGTVFIFLCLLKKVKGFIFPSSCLCIL